jgi:aldose sugar dehydrogenase
MRRTVIVLVLLLGSVVVAIDAQELRARPDGRALYGEHCAQCHGADLGGGNAGSLVDGIWNHGAGSGYVRMNIKNGITHLGMPAYEGALSDGEINAVASFLLEQEKTYDPKPRPVPEMIQSQEYDIRVEVVAEGLEVPWAIAFPDERTILVTERAGRLRLIEDGVLRPEPVAGIPPVVAEGQGGLMDVAIDPEYSENGWIYLALSHALPETRRGGRRPPAMTRIVRGRIRKQAWVDQEVIFEAPKDTYLTTRHHYGSRIAFDPEGLLYFSIGDRGARPQAQDLSKPNGKIHRIERDGRIPGNNPFVKTPGALPSIFSYGHRNPQGLAVHPGTGLLWETEHGPMGGDEVNLIRSGLNYGWPEISYGRHYDGRVLTEYERKPGMEQPMLFYRPSTAVCGLDFYDQEQFGLWRNHLLVGALKYESVDILTVEADRVMHSETIVKGMGRVRDVAVGPDGAVYVVLNRPGSIIRLTPIRER